MTTGIPETIYLNEPLPRENAIMPSIVVDDNSSDETILKTPQQLKSEFPVNDELISIKILNINGEVIEKWQGKSKKVIHSSMSFLENATEGIYQIKGILIDGSESSFLFKKVI